MPSNDENKYAATTWGHSTEFDFETPSGQLCRMRRIDPTKLISMGILDQLDFLSGHVLNDLIPNGRRTAAQKAKDSKENVGKSVKEREREARDKALKEMMDSPEKIEEFTKVLDKVVVAVVMEPSLALPPQPDPEPSEYVPPREEGVVYTDTIDFNDKVAIFNRATKGVSSLEQFREGSEEAVGDVAPVQRVRRKSAKSAS
jgi:hypothetical protein